MDWTIIVDATTAIATALIALTGIVALIYARRQLNQARETERVKHLVEFNREFDSEPMTKWRKIVAEKRLRDASFPDEALRLLDFFETIGLLVRRGYLDESDVWSTFSYWMFNIYADFRSDIEQMQRADEHYYSDSCELLGRLREIEKEMGSNDDRPSPEEIRDFWKEEANIVAGSPLKKRRRTNKKILS